MEVDDCPGDDDARMQARVRQVCVCSPQTAHDALVWPSGWALQASAGVPIRTYTHICIYIYICSYMIMYISLRVGEL
jgi:hypothetical protein